MVAAMAGQILTVVSASVDPTREADLAAAYETVLRAGLPDGLLATALMRGDGNRWQIATLWRDQAALDAMRAAAETPAAQRVFRQVDAEPTLAMFEVIAAVQRQD
jgi:hypothetical protein